MGTEATKLKRASTEQTPKVSVQRNVSEEEIRLRAYEIYVARGATPGCELDDWLEAERELEGRE
jgi:hypothetical protein